MPPALTPRARFTHLTRGMFLAAAALAACGERELTEPDLAAPPDAAPAGGGGLAAAVTNGSIAFTRGSANSTEIYAMNPDGSEPLRLTTNGFYDDEPSWSPDGTKIAFVTNRNGNFEIYVMNADGSDQVRLTNHTAMDAGPAWSPDGTKIAFWSDRNVVAEIFVMNADGSSVTRVTNNTFADSDPVWSPDGARLAYTSLRGNNEVFVINANGTGETNLTNHASHDEDPAWSPDGSRIAFETFREGIVEVYIMNADGTGQTGLSDGYGFEPAWSPDGSKIAYSTLTRTPGDFGNSEIFVMNANGTGLINLTNHPEEDLVPAWAPAPGSQNQAPSGSISAPAADVTIQPGQSVSFAGTGTDLDGTIASYAWSFPGGSPSSSTAQSPGAVTYAAPGTYTASLTVTDDDQAPDLTPATRTITVQARSNRIPVADAGGPYSGVEGSVINFDGTGSTDPDGDPLTYAWDFGDGGSATGGTPNHTFSGSGSFTVTLTVSDGGSEPVTTQRDFRTVLISNALPVVNAGADGGVTAGASYSFSGSFSDPGASDGPWSYRIDWGDGSTATTGSAGNQSAPITASHTFAAAGSRTLRLTVTDKDGGSSSDTRIVTVQATPPANQAPNGTIGAPAGNVTIQAGQSVSFAGNGSDNDGTITSYAWSFPGGSPSTGSGPNPGTVTYATAGTYTASLVVRDDDGAPDPSPATRTITVQAAPGGRVAVEISARPGTSRDPIRLGNWLQPAITVTLLTKNGFNAALVAPATLTLGDERGGDTRVARLLGRPLVTLVDVDRDGDRDLIAVFSKGEMRSNGDLTTATTQLVLLGGLTNGRTLRGAIAVRVVR